MDSPDLDRERHLQALRALARINLLSLAAQRVWVQVRRISAAAGRPLRILDVACGGGDVALAIKRKATRLGLPLTVEACDISPVAVGFAREAAEKRGLDVTFLEHDATRGSLPGGFDLVFSSLFLHHLRGEQAASFLGSLAAAGRVVLVQDLLRTRVGYLLALGTPRAITRSRVVFEDGVRSVRAAYSLPEVAGLVRQANLRGARVRRCWPQRFSLTWEAP